MNTISGLRQELQQAKKVGADQAIQQQGYLKVVMAAHQKVTQLQVRYTIQYE
jgi:hypothetical protein